MDQVGTAKALKKVPVLNAGKTGTAQVYSYDTRKNVIMRGILETMLGL
jgi:hypothetical protein